MPHTAAPPACVPEKINMTDVLSWIRLPGPFLIGHRGYPAMARENTRLSFEAALDAGCDGVELDVHVTADGVPVVHHDPAARTASGTLTLAETSWDGLAGLEFLDEKGPYRVERLDAVLDMLSRRALINVEVKPPGPGRHQQVGEAVLAGLERARPRESVLVSSFDPEMLDFLDRRDASWALAFLFNDLRDYNRFEQEALVERLTAVHPRHDLIDAKFMKRANERGLMVHAWTVDDPGEAARLVELGVRGVVTNVPDRIPL